MNTGYRNERSLLDWKLGMNQIRNLGATFAAFYGAEPLEDFKNLPEVIQHAEGIGIETTCITSYYFNETCKERLKRLYDAGLRSLTTSYDPIAYDKDSEKKSAQAIEMLEFFQSLGSIRNVAAVVTVTTDNLKTLPDTARMLTAKGIWLFCDLMHWDRGQPGSKCQGPKMPWHLDDFDIHEFSNVFQTMLNLRDTGYLVHMDAHTIKTIKNDGLQYKWNCAECEEFPSWVTISPSGIVYPCDDFKPDTKVKFDMTEIEKKWTQFSAYWRKKVKKQCPGCLWCTHIQSHNIKGGILDVEAFIHEHGGKK
jgi:radical SAM protein with 4Fe4S-binding SPASM domain